MRNIIQQAVSSDSLLDQAQDLHRRGQLPQAEALYRRILVAQPLHLDALQLLGILEFQLGRYAAAADLLQRAVSMAPEAAALNCNLGLALQQLKRYSEAMDCHDRALALKPDFAEALNNRANVLRELGRANEAVSGYERALQIRPDFSEALYNLGCIRLELERPQDALECLARCLRLAPQHPGALGQSGVALMALQRPQEALASFERALQLLPDDAETHYWRGNALLALARAEEAAGSYRRALQLRPDIPEAHYNLANTLLDLHRYEEALLAYDRALDIRPDYVEALYNRSSALQEQGRYEEAITGYERLMALAPGHRYAPGKLFHSRQFCCDWQHYAKDVQALMLSSEGDRVHDMPLSFLAVTDQATLQLRCARTYTAQKYPVSLTPLASGQPYRHDRIRVAYVSADFREHALSYLLAGLFEHHDRSRFETIAISLRPRDESPMGRRVTAAFERFIDTSGLTDAKIAALMRELEIDIAVDLAGYTEDNRTAIFAMRPAPIQVNYLGFPGTMGAQHMDYIIADAYVIPESARQHYAERVVWLPDCYQGNDDKREIASRTPGRAEAGLPESGFVFCAFNNLYKINPPLFDVWMRLLRGVPDSVLWIAADSPVARRNLAAEAARRGVDARRLAFSPRIPYPEHLARLRLADLFLDTLPFNAGTTASDALWAGLPVLTCSGEAFAARMAGSLLGAIGLPELITHSLEEYEMQALRLAGTPAMLADIRTRLDRNRNTWPLFDTRLFCRHLELAYLAMWEQHQRGEPPAAFSIARI